MCLETSYMFQNRQNSFFFSFCFGELGGGGGGGGGRGIGGEKRLAWSTSFFQMHAKKIQ